MEATKVAVHIWLEFNKNLEINVRIYVLQWKRKIYLVYTFTSHCKHLCKSSAEISAKLKNIYCSSLMYSFLK